jgi:hypothetical protein
MAAVGQLQWSAEAVAVRAGADAGDASSKVTGQRRIVKAAAEP